jgi:hypothetical protein
MLPIACHLVKQWSNVWRAQCWADDWHAAQEVQDDGEEVATACQIPVMKQA